MKKYLAAGFLSICLMGGAASVQANKSPEEMQEKMEDHLKKMTKDLNLTVEQQQTVRSALQEKTDAMKAAQDKAHEKIRAALTPEQAQKFDTMKAKKSK